MASSALTVRTAGTAVAESETFSLMQREAKLFSNSPLIPQHLRQGGPEQAMANCYIALKLARTMGEDPLVVLQNIHIVNGKAGFASQYMIARANAAGIFKGRIDWRIERGQNLSVTAFAVLRDTEQEVSVTVDMAMAQAEGWTKNPKYKSMPEVMLRYRSAAFLVRFYAPDVMLGYHTTEEVEDVRFANAAPAGGAITAAMIEAQADVADADYVEASSPNRLNGIVEDHREGRDDADMGEAHNGVDPQTGELFDDPARITANEIIAEIEAAADIDALGAVMTSNRQMIVKLGEDLSREIWEVQAKRKHQIAGGK